MSSRKKAVSRASLKLTERALADLRQIEQFSIHAWGRKAADKYLDHIAAALDRLRENPGILHAEPGFSPGLYFYRVNKHFLVCEIQGKAVYVLTVIHTSMDLPARLTELEPHLDAEVEALQRKLRKESGSE